MSIPNKLIMYPENDQLISLNGLFDIGTQLFFGQGAQVTATLYDQQGNAVPSCTNIQLLYILGSNGSFQGTVEETFNPPPGGGYRLKIDAHFGGADAEWVIPVDIQLRSKV